MFCTFPLRWSRLFPPALAFVLPSPSVCSPSCQIRPFTVFMSSLSAQLLSHPGFYHARLSACPPFLVRKPPLCLLFFALGSWSIFLRTPLRFPFTQMVCSLPQVLALWWSFQDIPFTTLFFWLPVYYLPNCMPSSLLWNISLPIRPLPLSFSRILIVLLSSRPLSHPVFWSGFSTSLFTGNLLCFVGSPSHVGVPGNEQVNALARSASSSPPFRKFATPCSTLLPGLLCASPPCLATVVVRGSC